MTVEYVHKVYGAGRIYDAELGAWREPMTEVELRIAKQYAMALERSFREVGGNDVPNKNKVR